MVFFTKLLNPLLGAPAGERSPSSAAPLVKYYDREGRKRFATADEWRRTVLPQQVARAA
jgi:hypothetical protein